MGDGLPTHEPPTGMPFQHVMEQTESPKTLLTEFQYDFNVHHQLVTENLLDPSHISYLYEGEVQGVSRKAALPLEIEIEETSPDGFQGKFRSSPQERFE